MVKAGKNPLALWDFPDGLAVNNPSSVEGWSPGQGTNNPHAAWHRY